MYSTTCKDCITDTEVELFVRLEPSVKSLSTILVTAMQMRRKGTEDSLLVPSTVSYMVCVRRGYAGWLAQCGSILRMLVRRKSVALESALYRE